LTESKNAKTKKKIVPSSRTDPRGLNGTQISSRVTQRRRGVRLIGKKGKRQEISRARARLSGKI